MSRFHVAMTASGFDTITVSVRAHIWLRSAAKDSIAALKTLAHEYVHAILRQNMPAEKYMRLPDWFREGVAVHLAGQHRDRLWVALAHKWENPSSLHDGLADGPVADPYLKGSWWFRALDKHHGPGTTRRLLGALIKENDWYEASVAIECPLEEIWKVAENNAAEEVQEISGSVAPLLSECLELRSSDRDECRKCLKKLIEEYPESYAAEYALFFAARLSYQQQYLKDAREFLKTLSHCRRDYGLGDDTLFLRLLIAYDSDRNAEAHRCCREYFTLWPDGNYFGRVQTICRRLR